MARSAGSKCCSGIFLFLWVIICGWLLVLYRYKPAAVTSSSTHLRLSDITFQSSPLINLDKEVHNADPKQQQHQKVFDAVKTPVNPVAHDSQQHASSIEPSSHIGETKKEDDPGIHIVFSTDCSFFQDWQTIVVFHSAGVVGQRGPITRIASGCSDAKKEQLKALYQKLYPQYHVHFTPDFKMDGKTKKKYDFYNKPFGVEHWLDNADPPIKDGVVVALIDPDFIFLRPLTVDVLNKDNSIPFSGLQEQIIENEKFMSNFGVVRKGHPAGQRYGLGAPWATPSRNFNRTDVCGQGSPCLNVHHRFGEVHYSVGPPYMLEKTDLLRLTKSWTRFVPKVYERYPELLAEMYAYSIAGAHEDLPHLTMEHFMVSNVHVDVGEGWRFIDDLGDDVCQPPNDQGIYYPSKPLPTFLHHCQFFRIGDLGFQKRRVRGKQFECESPLFIEPPLDIGKLDYKNRDGEIIKLGRKEARRNAFMICVIHRALNGAILDYKKRTCEPGRFINQNKTLNIVAEDY